MRVMKEIAHPECKITIFAWNQKFLLKFERGMCEQTFKISQLDQPDLTEIEKALTPAFISSVVSRFEQMHATLGEVLKA